MIEESLKGFREDSNEKYVLQFLPLIEIKDLLRFSKCLFNFQIIVIKLSTFAIIICFEEICEIRFLTIDKLHSFRNLTLLPT